jgi:hypothetical protein
MNTLYNNIFLELEEKFGRPPTDHEVKAEFEYIMNWSTELLIRLPEENTDLPVTLQA